MTRSRLSAIGFLLVLVMTTASLAQEPSPDKPVTRPRAAKPPQKVTPEPTERDKAERVAPSPEAEMRRVIDKLATQITALTNEVQLLRKSTERNSMTLELLLSEERLAKVEENLDAAITRKAQLDANEQDIQRRMRNIQQELVFRGVVRRDEAEAALRAEFQRALEDTHNQQQVQQQRIAELQTQAARLRERVEALRKKLERAEAKTETKEQ
jgi:chromosome segregation ATPase